ncbi:hypothetical protein [Asaia bogorensis]|nr:hypothetical protein [Asaia bogorensis]ETC97746.1 hypothetical protein P792_13805 [Asaia sp. SF2.1]
MREAGEGAFYGFQPWLYPAERANPDRVPVSLDPVTAAPLS